MRTLIALSLALAIAALASAQSRRPPEPPACVHDMASREQRLKQRQAALRALVEAGAGGGAAGKDALEKMVSGTDLFAGWRLGLLVEVMPLYLSAKVRCDTADSSNATPSSECGRARSDAELALNRSGAVAGRVGQAFAQADRALGTLRREGDDPAGKVVTATRTELQELGRQIKACEAEIKRGIPASKATLGRSPAIR